MFDVFISYRHADADAVRRIATALRAQRLTVWLDERRIDDFASIQRAIENGLAQSRALLAWYSRAYPESLACQWELTRAFVMAQHEGDVRRRLLVINPHDDNLHIQPIELRDALYLGAAGDDPAALAAAASAIAGQVRGLEGSLGDIAQLERPRWYGAAAGEGSNRFVGRLAEMWAVHSGLWQVEVPLIHSGALRPLVRLTGLGGCGKTLAAETYAIRYGAAYPGGVFWLRAMGHDAVVSLDAAARAAQLHGYLVDIAQSLGVLARGKDVAQLRSEIRSRLNECGAYLWVVDDLPGDIAWSAAQDWFAPGEPGRTLVTTRASGRGWAGSQVELAGLDETAAVALLGHARPPATGAESVAARALARELSYHPLALELAAVGVASQGYAEFHARLARPDRDALDFAAELMTARGDDLPHRDASNLSLSTTLLLSVDALDDLATDLLRLAGQIAAAPIARELACDVLARCPSATALNAADAALARDAAELAIAALLGRSLARADASGAFSVHGLVSRAMRFREGDRERATALHAAAIAALNAALLDDRVFDLRRHHEIADYVRHARAALDQEPASAPALETASAQLLDSLYIYAMEHGDFAAARRAAERLIVHARATLGEEHPHTLSFHGYLGQVKRSQGDLAGSLATHEAVLAARRRLFGETHPDTLTSLSDTALTLYMQGHYARARSMQQQVLEARIEILGMRHADTATAMNNLAITLAALGSEPAVALLLQTQAVELRRELLGPGHPETLSAIANLAEVQRLAGLQQAAHEGARQVFDSRAVELAADHPDRVLAINNLAASLYSEGDLAGSRDLFRQVLDRRERDLGERHPLTLATVNNLGAVLIGLGEHGAAAELLAGALGRCRESLGAQHPETFKAAWHLLMAESRGGDARGQVRELLANDLSPLMQCDPDDLPPDLRSVREALAAFRETGGSLDGD